MITTLPSPTPLPSNVPANIANNVSFYKDVAYSEEHARATLDLYCPNGGADNKPTLIFIHGGGFLAGQKENVQKASIRKTVIECLKNDCQVISINYELVQQPVDPMGLNRPFRSIQRALAHIMHSAEVLGINVDSWGLMGSSAGAYASQWFSMKEFGLIEGDPLLNISIKPKFAISVAPNWTMDLFRIEAAELWGEGVTIDDLLNNPDLEFGAKARAWYAQENLVLTRKDLSNLKALTIMKRFDPVHNEMYTPEMSPLYMIYTNVDDGQNPDTTVEILHNKLNPAIIYDFYADQGVECYVWGANPIAPIEDLPASGIPEFYGWLIDQLV